MCARFKVRNPIHVRNNEMNLKRLNGSGFMLNIKHQLRERSLTKIIWTVTIKQSGVTGIPNRQALKYTF